MNVPTAEENEMPDPESVDIAIVGAGLGGIGMARALLDEGRTDFVVLERASDIGGTWRDNTYPGCACDIPSVLYSYADEPNPDWSHAYASQPEINAYLHGVAARHDVAPHVRLGAEVLEAEWVPDAGRWEIDTPRGRYRARVLISATGVLADPSIPELPGLSDFAGRVFHSARWDHDHDLRGRRVAVIGTGASAIQFVPEIQPVVEHLDLFQRTPPWVLPRGNPPIPNRLRRALRRRPRLLELLRAATFSGHEAVHVGFRHPALMRVIERRVRRHIEQEIADPELRAKLIPDYRLGCKRILGSMSWYPALRQPNVEVVTAGIDRIVPAGIVDRASVEHAVDTIIFGTGFLATDPPISHRLRGRGGRTLAEAWAGSPMAHLGIAVSGFPNLFMLHGPNTALGHNSVLLMIESQVGYVRQALALLDRRGGTAAMEPTLAAQAAFRAEVERGTEGTVWTAGGCSSWYLDATGHNSVIWPGSVRAYQRRIRRLDPDDYLIEEPRSDPSRTGEPALV